MTNKLAEMIAALRTQEQADADGCRVTVSREAIDEAVKVLLVIQAFRDKHEITCPESVFQCDSVVVEATEFVGDVLDVVGYCPPEEDE